MQCLSAAKASVSPHDNSLNSPQTVPLLDMLAQPPPCRRPVRRYIALTAGEGRRLFKKKKKKKKIPTDPNSRFCPIRHHDTADSVHCSEDMTAVPVVYQSDDASEDNSHDSELI